MFRIRKVLDDSTPANAAVLAQVQEILRSRFPLLDPAEVEALPEKLRNPLKYRFRPILLVGEDGQSRVRGFALLLHAPDVNFCYLDFVAAAGRDGGGVGGALYERVREEALALGVRGLFFECLPDDPALSPDAEVRAENAARLRFYERYGARPIVGTAYETPVRAGDTDPPYLVFDGLARGEPLGRNEARKIVRQILERKYAAHCPPEYITRVVESFRDDPVPLRAPRYSRRRSPKEAPKTHAANRVLLVVNDRHDIHHIRERGYVEAPARVRSIVAEIDKTALFERIEPRRFPDAHVHAVHDSRLVSWLERTCRLVGEKRSVYPYVFPIRNAARPPKELPIRAGYFCIDTFTPINGNAYLAARRAVDCTLTAAEDILRGRRFAYALVRPPGHHAERRAFGGFCYFNNAAIAANYLSRYGRVVVLDVDYHHGNGTQDIFYERADVMTISIHGHPNFAYPYFSGFKDETGKGEGAGFNLNMPLPEDVGPDQYRETLARALRQVERFGPGYLVVAAGFDTAKGDPTGSWSNRGEDFERMGAAIGALGLPTLIVQEGGYRVRTLGANVRRFFEGLWSTVGVPAKWPGSSGVRRQTAAERAIKWREHLRASDVERIRALVAAADVFTPEETTVAAELVSERIATGPACGYEFVLAERGKQLLGFACFGHIPGTQDRFDLYWLAVAPEARRLGVGNQLLARGESAIAARGGTRVYVDTSMAEHYDVARKFYISAGYHTAAELPDFYRPGDGKIIYVKDLNP